MEHELARLAPPQHGDDVAQLGDRARAPPLLLPELREDCARPRGAVGRQGTSKLRGERGLVHAVAP
ncbi:hypothetical protein GALL_347550 [mine drainage metagenome]|uniref:Uncharacterized protein n=1 Tax=mine drainage metagenome TaxID=410659 RepID=A0A1J5QIS1_9ZZZZ